MLFFFSAASYLYIFRNSPCRKNAPSFSANHQTKIFSPAFSSVTIFSLLLMNMPIIYIEGIKTTLLTLYGCILGFIGGKVDSAPNNTRFMTSPSEFTNFQILNFQLFQFSHLLEVIVLPGQIPTIRIHLSLRFYKDQPS